MDGSDVVAVVVVVLIGLPWLVLHYMTKWKTAATLTNDDESLLEELFQLARRLDDRMETVERLVAADNPDFRAARLVHDRAEDTELSRELDRLRGREKTSAAKGSVAR